MYPQHSNSVSRGEVVTSRYFHRKVVLSLSFCFYCSLRPAVLPQAVGVFCITRPSVENPVGLQHTTHTHCVSGSGAFSQPETMQCYAVLLPGTAVPSPSVVRMQS